MDMESAAVFSGIPVPRLPIETGGDVDAAVALDPRDAVRILKTAEVGLAVAGVGAPRGGPDDAPTLVGVDRRWKLDVERAARVSVAGALPAPPMSISPFASILLIVVVTSRLFGLLCMFPSTPNPTGVTA
ncbi:MAG: hypothetical protein V3V08_00830 [Nannocystaceae bacterium]